MGLLSFRALLVINVFSIGTENLVTPKPYRFSVYPVNKCPGSKTEFQRAAQKKNCTKGLRYLCAPNKYLSSLIEFCTDRHRSLYGKGNCVILEGTGDLDHYNCVEKFNRSCPSKPYYDEEIYKYPACLEIDKDLRCFVADKICNEREFSTTETHLNISKMEPVGNETLRGAFHGWLAIVYIIALVSAGIILILVIFRRREREELERHKNKDETELCLKDQQSPIEENDNIQLDQASVNAVSKLNQIQTTSTKMLHETTKTEIRSKTILRDEEENKESGQNAALINGIHQDNPEIDDDKLRHFLSKGEITVSHVRCIIVGCGKAGKTTLLKRLENVPFEKLQTKKTEIVDLHVNSFEVLIEEETIKKKEETLPTILFSKEQLKMPLKENAGKMTEERAQPGIRKKDVSEKYSLKKTQPEQKENIPKDTLQNPANSDDAKNEEKSIFEPHSQDKTPVQNQSSPKTNEKHGKDIDAYVDKINFENYAILKIKDAVSELLNETDLRPRITFLDFGGQSMYYPFHQLFLRPQSCSILVVDMTKSLNDEVDVEDNIEKKCSQFNSWRYRDYYKFWLKSIDSFSDPKSPVIIVGTHADKLSRKGRCKYIEDLFNFFNEMHHFNLRRHLNADRMFTIGFPETGSELEDLKDLKKCIANIVKAPCYLKENIRPVWALFEQLLITIKEDGKKVIPRKILSKYSEQLNAQGFRIDDSEISKMLVFLHRVGIVLYFENDVLKDDIVLDIQWLFGAFKCIIKYSVKIWMNDTPRKQFYCTGELDDRELEKIWETEKDYLQHKTTIIAYMQQLGLLTLLPSVDSTVYYFPSMNSKKFDRTGGNNSKSSILSFKFDEEGQLPFNVFHCIVFKCLKLNNWAILREGENKCLYQNAACFSFKHHVVVLCNCNFEIRVQVWASPDGYDAKLLKKIKHSIEGIIQENERLSYEIGYKCQKDVLNNEEDVSFIPQYLFPVSKHLCEICPVDKKHDVDNDICWDNGVNEEKEFESSRMTSDICTSTEKNRDESKMGSTSEEKLVCATTGTRKNNIEIHKTNSELKGADDTLNTTKTSIPRLLKIGENVDSRDQDGGTPLLNACLYSPLMTACQKGDDNIGEILLNNKADINACDNRGENSLWKACACGHESTVKILISNGADVNFSSKDGCAPLHIACENGHFNLAQLLIDNGADINLCDKDGCNALLYASTNGHGIIVELLLKNKADVDLCNKDGESPLIFACQNGHDSIARLLLQYNADIDLCSNSGTSPIYAACKEGHKPTVELLINSGACVNSNLKDGTSALMIACENGFESITQTLLEKGAKINWRNNRGYSPLIVACQKATDSVVRVLLERQADINLCNKKGSSALYKACQEGHNSTIDILLSYGADVNLCKEDGSSPLHIACECGWYNTVKLLLRYDIVNINLCDRDGCNALIYACQNGHDKIVELLLNHHLDVNSCSRYGKSSLHFACENGKFSTAQLLLNKKADIRLCDNDGRNALIFACQNGYDKIAQLLLKHGADINVCSKNGCSVLYLTCEKEQLSTVEFLMKNGADVNICNKDGYSPLEFASREGYDNVIQLFIEAGADINFCSENGTRPIHEACSSGQKTTVDLLLRNGVDVNLLDSKGFSALSYACIQGNETIAFVLLKNNANVNLCSNYETTPLLLASFEGLESIIQLLLKYNADVNLCSKDGGSPLLIACLNENAKTAEILLENGANVNQSNKRGYTPLIVACQEGNEKIVQLLLNKMADINLCNENGASPLYKACQQGHDDVINILLSEGADVNLCRKDGLGPLHIASINKHVSLVELLLKKGADINLCDKEGYPAFAYASEKGYESIQQLFLEYGADMYSFTANHTPSNITRQDSTLEILDNDDMDIVLRYDTNNSPI